MDGFADGMTARGPTLGTHRQSWTRSLHVVKLPDTEAAREFVAREPYNQAGQFENHRNWCFADILGQTVWQFADAEDEPQELSPVPLADLPPELRERLILYDELRNLNDDEPAGVSLGRAGSDSKSTRRAARRRTTGLADCHDVEVHDWEFGGRR